MGFILEIFKKKSRHSSCKGGLLLLLYISNVWFKRAERYRKYSKFLRITELFFVCVFFNKKTSRLSTNLFFHFFCCWLNKLLRNFATDAYQMIIFKSSRCLTEIFPRKILRFWLRNLNPKSIIILELIILPKIIVWVFLKKFHQRFFWNFSSFPPGISPAIPQFIAFEDFCFSLPDFHHDSYLNLSWEPFRYVGRTFYRNVTPPC